MAARKYLTVFLILIVSGCMHEDKEFENKIQNSAKHTNNIDFKLIVTEAWDRLYIYDQYTDHNKINQKHNLQLPTFFLWDFVCENCQLMIFKNGNQVSKTVLIKSKYGDFRFWFNGKNEISFTRDQAVFQIENYSNKNQIIFSKK